MMSKSARLGRAVSGRVSAGLVALFAFCAHIETLAAAGPAGPSVAEVVEMTRIVQPRKSDSDDLRAQVSPDGRSAFIVVRQALVKEDLNRYRILLLDLDSGRLSGARPRPARALYSLDVLDDRSYGRPAIRDARWLNDRTIVFLGRVQGAPMQVYRLDVMSGHALALTREANPIVSFAVSDDLRRVVYAVQVPNPPLPPGERSIVVGNRSFWSVMHGQQDLVAQQRYYQYAVADVGSGRPARRLGSPFPETSRQQPTVDISPDGRWALLHKWEPDRQQAWASRYPLLASALERHGPASRIDPLQYFSQPTGHAARRLVAYRLGDGAVRQALDAPDDALPGLAQRRRDRMWVDGGRSVIIAGTHLPWVGADKGPSASYVVEYWPDQDRWQVIAELRHRLTALHADIAGGQAFTLLDGEVRRTFERSGGRGWIESTTSDVSRGAVTRRSEGEQWRLRFAESLDTPPDVVAEGPDGQTVPLTRLHTQHRPEEWGTMQPFSWTDAQGRRWDGGLMTPAGHDPRHRMPLIIQTYGFADSKFYLDGANLSSDFTSGFPGRALLREGFLVLAFPTRPGNLVPVDEPSANKAFADGVRGAIEALASQGLVDRERVGILGWSATGERVLNLLAFSDVPIRAATLLDGDANTLFSLTITYGFSDSTQVRKEQSNGGGPFGSSLETWVRSDPSLNTDCIDAALRIETYGPWVLNNWDIHALMRRQYKPVEMIVIPGGAHALSRPSERMLSLQGNVDWYRFWLKGEERREPILQGETSERLAAQYARWHQMRELHKPGERAPRCSVRGSAEVAAGGLPGR